MTEEQTEHIRFLLTRYGGASRVFPFNMDGQPVGMAFIEETTIGIIDYINTLIAVKDAEIAELKKTR